jgi:FkbM family methyltransferase
MLLERKIMGLKRKIMGNIRDVIWQFLYKRNEVTLTRNTLQGKYSFSSKDKFIGRALYTWGFCDKSVIDRAIQLLQSLGKLDSKDNNCLIDVGMNIGTISIYLVKNKIFSRAIGFEPEPKNFQYCKANIIQNGLDSSMSAYCLAVSDKDGETLSLKLSSDNYGDHRLLAVTNNEILRESKDKVIEVPIITLDKVIEKPEFNVSLSDIKLLWMDTQGHDFYVLKGASKIIESQIPIVIELAPFLMKQAEVDFDEFTNFITTKFNYVFDLRLDNPQKLSSSSIKEILSKYSQSQLQYTDLLLI